MDIAASTTTLLVGQDQWGATRVSTTDDAPLADGQIRVRIDRFALTANNITYAALGGILDYWRFFPSTEAGWGIVPAWGFGTVVQSRHPAITVNERFYGYWPMASQAVLTPRRAGPSGFSDAAPHRARLHAVYNQYLRSVADPFYQSGTEDVQALLRPLFTSAWLLDDFLHDQQFFGATRVLLSSASSKMAYGTAYQLAQRGDVEVIGLTSAGNAAFCESLGCYHRVVAYDALESSIDGAMPSVYIDVAGNAGLYERIHRHCTGLVYSCAVGASHVQDLGATDHLPGPSPVMFFAPEQAKKRQADWGAQGLSERLVTAWKRFSAAVQAPPTPWIAVRHHAGPQATQALFLAVLAGHGDPRAGHIATMQVDGGDHGLGAP